MTIEDENGKPIPVVKVPCGPDGPKPPERPPGPKIYNAEEEAALDEGADVGRVFDGIDERRADYADGSITIGHDSWSLLRPPITPGEMGLTEADRDVDPASLIFRPEDP